MSQVEGKAQLSANALETPRGGSNNCRYLDWELREVGCAEGKGWLGMRVKSEWLAGDDTKTDKVRRGGPEQGRLRALGTDARP